MDTKKRRDTNFQGEHEEIAIPEDEQWRIVDQTGILQHAKLQSTEAESEPEYPLLEEIFSAVTLIIPFSSLLVLMDILIHHQYAQRPKFSELASRLGSALPFLSLFIFYTTRYKQHRWLQLLLFLLALIVGPRMIYLVNKGSWLVNIKLCPPLATIWIYTVVQLDVGPAVLSLIFIYGWVWWKGLKIIF